MSLSDMLLVAGPNVSCVPQDFPLMRSSASSSRSSSLMVLVAVFSAVVGLRVGLDDPETPIPTPPGIGTVPWDKRGG